MRPIALLVSALLVSLPLQAQFWSELANPKVEVRLLHPPELGLRISRVALSPAQQTASLELSDTLADALGRDRRLQLYDPGRLTSSEAAEAALILVDVHRCKPAHSNTEKESKDSRGNLTLTRTATTTLEFKATLQVLEARSGKVLITRKFEESPAASTTSTTGNPDHPREEDLRKAVHRQVADWLFQALLPWEEVLKVTCFDDDNYSMDKAATRLKGGDPKGALEWAIRGEGQARSDKGGKSKFRERAIYNLGVVRMALGDFEGARTSLQEARDMNPDASIFRDTLKECQRALALQAAYDRWERAPAQEPPAPGTGRKDAEQRLIELDRLRKKGLITEDDFQRRKLEILREI